MKENIANVNTHVQKYLEKYLKFPKTECAILLKGKWGCGKTYFINSFIDEYKDFKFIKISLFGLKNISSIDDEIFQNLHPVLGSKYTKMVANTLKSAVKFGFNINDVSVDTDLKDFKLSDFFDDKKKSNEKIVFVFDDLERSGINLKELLGYINYLVEQAGFKVILLADEEKINDVCYQNFKEKIIGKTFEIKHSFEEILRIFIADKTNLAKNILDKNSKTIAKIYEISGCDNLRIISQILFDFEYFIQNIDEKFLKCEEFVSILINNFFAISIEIKSGKLTRDELIKYKSMLFDFQDNDKMINIKTIYEKYNIKDYPLFEPKMWTLILFDSLIQKEEINELISKLSLFLKEKSRPSWVKIWHYRELSDEEFTQNLNDVIDKFKDCKYDTPEHFIHVVALLVYFSKNNLCELAVKDIEKQVEICMDKYKHHENYRCKLIRKNALFNSTGLGYMNEEDADFRGIFKKILERNEEFYNDEEKKIKKETIEKIIRAMKDFDNDFLMNILCESGPKIPIFNHLDEMKFVKLLTNMENKNLTRLGEILHLRYNEYYQESRFLINELDFWKKVNERLNKMTEKTSRLKLLLLKQFNNYLVKDVIQKLEKCD